jgi:CubicO group peptidase (beta-lactamase class C family)
MSIAKSVLSALVAIAIAQGRIGSVDDPITRYVPELLGRDRRPPAFFARGKYAQHIYVVPESRLVLVRFGSDAGYQHWPQLPSNLASRLAR